MCLILVLIGRRSARSLLLYCYLELFGSFSLVSRLKLDGLLLHLFDFELVALMVSDLKKLDVLVPHLLIAFATASLMELGSDLLLFLHLSRLQLSQ